MNLFIFNESRPAALYGVGTYIQQLTAALQNSNHNICVVTLKQDILKTHIKQTKGIKYWSIPSPVSEQRIIDASKYNELYCRSIVYFLQLHITNKTNLVFHLNYLNCTLAEELKKVFECKIVSTIHYLDWSFILFGNVMRFRNLLTKQEMNQSDMYKNGVAKLIRDEKRFFENVDHLICLSENTRRLLLDDYQINPNKTTVIHNGLKDNITDLNKQDIRIKYYMTDIPVIIFAGRLDDLKGILYLLKAFKIVMNTYPHCQLVIAGNGSLEKYMNDCEDIWIHVTWTGLISSEKLYELYQIADIGVLPSLTEQCSYVAIEMMMHGLPMITTSAWGLAEMTEDGISGLHVPVTEHPETVEIDTELLAEKMLYLLKFPEERKRIGANARRRYESAYSAEIFRRNMLDFYYSLINTVE